MFADAWLKGLASGDQRRPTGSGSALEVCYTLLRYTSPRVLYFTYYLGLRLCIRLRQVQARF